MHGATKPTENSVQFAPLLGLQSFLKIEGTMTRSNFTRIALGIAFVSASSLARGQIYHTAVLTNPQGTVSSRATAINSAGEIVGFAQGQDGQNAILWTPDGSTRVLPDVGGQQWSNAYAINAGGDVAGFTMTNLNSNAAAGVIWKSDGTTTLLQSIGRFDTAMGLNSAGYAVGYADLTETNEAILWSPDGSAVVLQDVGGEGQSVANGINDAGEIVGFSGTADGHDEAVVWGLDGHGRVLSPTPEGYATAVNASGDIAGVSLNSAPYGYGAAIWGANGTLTLLTDPGTAGSGAKGLNNNGDAVGSTHSSNTTLNAVLWPASGAPVILPDLGGVGWDSAFGINDGGLVVGSTLAKVAQNQEFAVLWWPEGTNPPPWPDSFPPGVPEPSSWVLLICGAVGLGAFRISRRLNIEPPPL